MICGALQTLNEEACEDVMDEAVETKRRLSVTSNIQDPGEFQAPSLIHHDSLHDSHCNIEQAASSHTVILDTTAYSVSDLLSSVDGNSSQLEAEATSNPTSSNTFPSDNP